MKVEISSWKYLYYKRLLAIKCQHLQSIVVVMAMNLKNAPRKRLYIIAAMFQRFFLFIFDRFHLIQLFT